MASIEKRGKSFRVIFRYDGQRYTRSLHTRAEKVAISSLLRLEDNLRRVELGTLVVPENVDPADFLLSDGKASPNKAKNRNREDHRPVIRTLGKLCDAYLESMPQSAIESNTRLGLEIHIRHFKTHLGRLTSLKEIDEAALQRYINKRASCKGRRGQPLSAGTIKKEMSTLNTIWKWALRNKHVTTPLAKHDLRYPKRRQKPPFQTFDEVCRKSKISGLSQGDRDDLWDSVFLTTADIKELLSEVRKSASHAFIYPLFAFAAHTGARRSEMIRSRIHDIDLESKRALLREKKRVRGQETMRGVPLSPFLVQVMSDWFEIHPGGVSTFAIEERLNHGSKERVEPSPLTVNEATHHFDRTLKLTKWKNLRGWHVLRHSFCSNCAAAGVDQRIIDEWVGHQTEEMRRRYRHLIPSREVEAIASVFS